MEHETAIVLVVDDDPAVLRLLQLALGTDGFRTCTAVDGEQALERLESCSPDAIVLDIEMPVMDGPTFFRIMRARGCTTPVLVLSARGATAARNVGADSYLSKPFNPSELTRKLRALVA